jgi:hypothetical protein
MARLIRLDRASFARHRAPLAGGGAMRSKAGLALAILLLAGGCVGGSKCPKPVAYDEATLREIQKALTALPRDNILHQVMADYETERDDLRFCQ